MQPKTREEFERELGELVRAAYANDAAASNEGYTLRHDDSDIPDWEVVLVEVEKSGEVGSVDGAELSGAESSEAE